MRSRSTRRKKWIDSEFQPSTLSKDAQMAEMEWFISASKPFQGMQLSTVSEILKVHDYESKTLTRAFADITGIKVNHDLMDEGLLVDKIEVEMQSGRPVYDFWMNDSDFIGTHPRYNDIVDGSLTDFMQKNGKDVTSPTLDLADFMGLSFGTFTEGKLYQLPDQQFANLYWFRYDLFQKPELKAAFKKQFGYELGVPVNWSAYEDIADFFTNTVKEVDGKRIYGHMDYGKKDPSLGWRFTDAWLSMAGAGDRGLPNGKPVDEWGIRMENGVPSGSSITRGGDANGPAAVYALTKYVEWLKKYAPPEAAGMDFLEAGPVPGAGPDRAADLLVQRVHRQPQQARPARHERRRHAEMAHGAEPARRLLERGHEARLPGRRLLDDAEIRPDREDQGRLALRPVLHLQDGHAEEGALLAPPHSRERRLAPGDDRHAAPKLGGLVEFYRSPARKQWTPTGVNVPDYGKMAQVWWQNISNAISGAATPQQAMDGLARDQDAIMTRHPALGRAGQARPGDERGEDGRILVRPGREGRQPRTAT